MNSFWSWFVIVQVVLVIGGSALLLWRTSGKRAGEAAQETGHVWDEDLREYDKPLPRWWINLFYITIVFLVVYLVVFPGFGNLPGTQGWSSTGQHARDQAATDARLAATFSAYDGIDIDQLARDPDALALGRSLFGHHCAGCHGALGQGAVGYPDLTDGIWQWGGSPEQVLQSVLHGRTAAMPPWADALVKMGGENAVDHVAIYVQSLSDPRAAAQNPMAAAYGKPLFAAVCTACHGAEGKGNATLGAPDLTDDYWLYEPSRASIREGLRKGRNGTMPAHLPLLGETRARLAAAYVWSLSHPVAATQ
jgi:cytochrome c oxidase cbb3-type subunit 3